MKPTPSLLLAAALASTGPDLLAQDGITVFQGARVHPVGTAPIDGGVVVVAGGKIQAVGDAGTEIPSGATIVDCTGKVLTPGLVDAGTVLGVSSNDLNEQGDEVTPHLRVIDALDPADVRFERARGSGVTTVQINPGNRNVIGGLGAIVKTRGTTVAEMLVRDESGLRMTMGGEPSSGNRAIRGGTPSGIYYRRPTTRMGVVWEARKAFYDAIAYRERKTVPGDDPGESSVDPGLEVLIRALDKEIVVRTTARAEQDIRTALRLASEFGYRTLIEEATEAWRVIQELKDAGVTVLFSAPSRTSGRDGAEVRYHTLDLLASGDIPFVIHTGADVGSLSLVHEAMFAVRYGLDPEIALDAITRRAAQVLEIDDRVGTLAPGRDADLVVWSGNPFDPTTRVEAVWIDGREVER